MSWSRLQSFAGQALAATVTATPGSNLTAGTKLIAYVQASDGNAGNNPVVTGISDGNGNNFTQLAAVQSTGTGFLNNLYIFELDTPSGDAGTKPTITATLSGSSAVYGTMLVQEVSGLLAGITPLDGTAGTAHGTGNTSFSAGSPSYASGAANEYLVSVYGDDGDGSGCTWTAPGGYTADANSVNSNGDGDLAVAYKNSTGGAETGGYAVTTPGGSTNWGLILAAFQLASSTPSITTTSLPAATEGASYSASLTAGGGVTPYTWSISGGSLPGWASLNASTGVISGTAPGTPGTTQFTVEVTDASSNTATQQLSLAVGPQPYGSPPGGPWLLALNDDFLGSTWNQELWAPNFIWGTEPYCRSTDDSLQISYSPRDNRGMTVAGSVLSLNAANVGAWPAMLAIDPLCPNPLPSGNQATYSAGFLSSHPGFKITEGYLEVSMRVPYPVVAGSWPAFWSKTLGDFQPELDYAEFNVSGNTGEMHSGYDDDSGTYHNHYAVFPSDHNFHTYGCKITATAVTFYWDGTQVYTTPLNSTPPWHIILDHFVYSAATGTGFPCSADFDWARAWVVLGVPAQPVISAISPVTGIPASGSVTVSFPAVSGAASYRVTAFPTDYYADSGGSLPAGSPPSATGTSSPITVTGLTNGYRYNVTVAAINATGYSIESLPVPSLAPASGSGLPQWVSRATPLTSKTFSPCSAAGDFFAGGDTVFVEVANSGGSPVTCTVTTPGEVENIPETAYQFTVPASGETEVGPFPSHLFGPVAAITYSDATDLSIAVKRYGS